MPVTRRDILQAGAAGVLGGFGVMPRARGGESTGTGSPPNVLFIAVDDLRPALGCYGVAEARTPNLDAFAASGVTFLKHFVQVPTCGASRYALLTGRRPDTPAALSNGAFTGGSTALPAGDSPAGARTMPELFRRNGYRTVCIGKISHQPDGKVFAYNGTGDGRPEMPDAWDELATPYGSWGYGWGAFFAYDRGKHREDKSGYAPYAEFPDVGDSDLPDGMMADAAVAKLKDLARDPAKPFFLGLGFYKPHLPFVSPKRYRDPFDGVALPSVNGMALGESKYRHGSGEFYRYSMELPGAKDRDLTEEGAQDARRAYFAAVSYTDAQVGRVLAALEETGLSRNTIVVVWGDHGWHLGEHRIWGKHSPLEVALRSAFLVRAPGITAGGGKTEAVVESLDIYPTLVDLCGLRERRTAHPLAGVSLRAVLENPDHPGKTGAFSYWRDAVSLHAGPYRLIAGAVKNGARHVELYDHRDDPGELRNIAAANPETVAALLRQVETQRPVLAGAGG